MYLASCLETQNFILMISAEAGVGGGGRLLCGRTFQRKQGVHRRRHPPAEVNSPVPGLLPLHPQLLGRWKGEEILAAEGNLSTVGICPLHPPLLPRQEEKVVLQRFPVT